MPRDLLAELDGYRNERARYRQFDRKDRVAAVEEQIERVKDEIRGEVDKLRAAADAHIDAGQDLNAAEAQVEARRLEKAMERDSAGDPEDAAQNAPRETTAAKRPPQKKA